MPDNGPRSGPNGTDLRAEWQRRDHLPLGLGEHNRETLEGRIELAAYIANNIRGAYMADSPHGADPSYRATTR